MKAGKHKETSVKWKPKEAGNQRGATAEKVVAPASALLFHIPGYGEDAGSGAGAEEGKERMGARSRRCMLWFRRASHYELYHRPERMRLSAVVVLLAVAARLTVSGCSRRRDVGEGVSEHVFLGEPRASLRTGAGIVSNVRTSEADVVEPQDEDRAREDRYTFWSATTGEDGDHVEDVAVATSPGWGRHVAASTGTIVSSFQSSAKFTPLTGYTGMNEMSSYKEWDNTATNRTAASQAKRVVTVKEGPRRRAATTSRAPGITGVLPSRKRLLILPAVIRQKILHASDTSTAGEEGETNNSEALTKESDKTEDVSSTSSDVTGREPLGNFRKKRSGRTLPARNTMKTSDMGVSGNIPSLPPSVSVSGGFGNVLRPVQTNASHAQDDVTADVDGVVDKKQGMASPLDAASESFSMTVKAVEDLPLPFTESARADGCRCVQRGSGSGGGLDHGPWSSTLRSLECRCLGGAGDDVPDHLGADVTKL